MRPLHLTMRAKLSLLAIVPLAVLLLLMASFAILESRARGAAAIAGHSDDAVSAYDSLFVTLLDAETGMRGFVMTGLPRFDQPFRAAALRLAPDLARVRALPADDAPENARRAHLIVLARQAFQRDAQLVALAALGGRAQAQAAVAEGSGKRAMDRFRAAIAILKSSALQQRAAGTYQLAVAWQRTYVLFGLGVFIGLATTTGLYVTISRNIIRRLRKANADALIIANNVAPGPMSPGNDEITVLERSLRKMFEFAQVREIGMNRYNLLLDHARDVIFWTDENDRIIEANGAALQVYGFTRDEMLALRSADLWTDVAVRTLPEKLALVRADGQAFFETENVRKTGAVFPVEMAINSTRIDGAEVNFIVVRDITERRHASAARTSAYEKAVESSRLKSQFVATMSHEIRTPMNAVIGMNELLLGTELSEEQREYTEIVRDSSLSLLGIIDDVLDFSKIEAGRLDLELLEMNVCDVVESAAALLGPAAQRKGISLMTYVHPDLCRTALGDSERLRQVLLNLIGNAVKFTQSGGVVVAVTLRSETETEIALEFSVSDSGEGFDEATAAMIFEPFRQADGSTTRKYGGTGLGLSISRRLVELMGGEFSVASTPGTGSRFGFSVALARVANEVPPCTESLGGSRVLVVDDVPSAREILKSYMLAWEIDADVAIDVPEALAALRAAAAGGKRYDVALIDHSLGDLTGFDLASAIRSDPTIAATRLIMITAYDGARRGEASIAAGFSSYLTKPVRQAQLYDCLAKEVSATQLTVPPAPRAPKPVVANASQYRSERILLVEDQPVNRRLAMQQLKKLGFAAEAVDNGEEAVNAVARERYDVILMDCHMPVMDGFAATRVIRMNEAHTGRRVPIVAMTANARREDREECLATGMDDYLAKPVQMEHLRGMLDSWLPPDTLN